MKNDVDEDLAYLLDKYGGAPSALHVLSPGVITARFVVLGECSFVRSDDETHRLLTEGTSYKAAELGTVSGAQNNGFSVSAPTVVS